MVTLNEDQRHNGLQRVKEGLGESWNIADTKEIGSKLHSLQVYYFAQKDKLENLKRSGPGTSDVKKFKWAFFDKLVFLNENLQPKHTFTDIINFNGFNPE